MQKKEHVFHEAFPQNLSHLQCEISGTLWGRAKAFLYAVLARFLANYSSLFFTNYFPRFPAIHFSRFLTNFASSYFPPVMHIDLVEETQEALSSFPILNILFRSKLHQL